MKQLLKEMFQSGEISIDIREDYDDAHRIIVKIDNDTVYDEYLSDSFR